MSGRKYNMDQTIVSGNKLVSVVLPKSLVIVDIEIFDKTTKY